MCRKLSEENEESGSEIEPDIVCYGGVTLPASEIQDKEDG